MKNRTRVTGLLLSTAILALGACSQNGPAVEQKISRSASKVNASLGAFGDRDAVRAGGAQLSSGVFMGAKAERSNAAAMLPSHVQGANAIRLESRDPLSLQEISQRLSDITGIAHLASLGPTGESAGGESSGLQMRPNLRGPLSEVLNEVASTFEVEWTFKDGRVVFQDYVTRQYQISALPTSTSAAASIGSNGMTSESSTSTDIWAEITQSVNTLVGDGANVSISTTTGMITVTAKVGDQNRVSEYVKDLNGNIGQQITFDVNVLTVTLNSSDSFGVNLEAAFMNAANAATQGALDESTTAINSIQAGAASGSVNIGVVDGDFSISSIVNALSTQGQVAVSTRAGATTSNNRMAPIEIVDSISYLAETQSETDENGQTRVRRIPGQTTTGFQLQIFPRILNNNELMVQYVVKLSELNALKTFGDGADAIQLPEIGTTSFEQQAVLKNGQTLILAGFERERAQSDVSGVGKAREVGLGGSVASSTARVATVLLIKPRIINRKTAVGSGR